ncbi:MAG: branched-chain amino acid aminotransferase [Fusobacteriaceae bacterium]|nr:branched-chain amino acid aminotransferase [Fusobacteriaceae bacterium]
MKIAIEQSKTLKPKPDQNNLGFGKYFTDHMFYLEYTVGIGWHDAKIIPYGPITMDPGAMVLHYAQEVFEGMKAYKAKTGKIHIFRPDMNAKRLRTSCERLYMPPLPEEMFIEAVKAIVSHEREWIPSLEGTSLYIRPFIFADDVVIGVHPGETYKFIIILSPVGSYYPEGINPVKIYVEEYYVRASKGGTGFTKCGGNYASSIIAQVKAQEKGYTQVLWLDGAERKYVEEVGTMNVMFKIENEIWTAPLDGSILPGVTRDSCITILKDMGYRVREELIPIDFLMESGRNGKLEEAFGTGTAAVISPIGSLTYKEETVTVNNFETGKLTRRLYDFITGIQNGTQEDKYNWIQEVL